MFLVSWVHWALLWTQCSFECKFSVLCYVLFLLVHVYVSSLRWLEVIVTQTWTSVFAAVWRYEAKCIYFLSDRWRGIVFSLPRLTTAKPLSFKSNALLFSRGKVLMLCSCVTCYSCWCTVWGGAAKGLLAPAKVQLPLLRGCGVHYAAPKIVTVLLSRQLSAS